ncbi:MAG: glutamate synthase large subunit, partial [Candidatus Omnitrophica bacterium]|nr:glutamate synthase large subunit [Candidatus Omnitrophota bacterium]
MNNVYMPKKQGLYDPQFEKDSCGVGFVCNTKGNQSHRIVSDGLMVLKRLAHRGAVGADPKTGDGAGILIQVPHEFFANISDRHEIKLPPAGDYGIGMVFLPRDYTQYEFIKNIFRDIVQGEGQALLGWRPVPVDDTEIGVTARDTQPVIEQVFIGRNGSRGGAAGLHFERRLYVIRKKVENAIRQSHLSGKASFYITNLSSRTLCYKGLLMPHQLEKYFTDLTDTRMKSALALVHSRYSTNTFPTWDLAQPFRFLAHNGEINTLRGNINWMRSREGLLESDYFQKDIKALKPVIVPGGSDSAAIDNVFELLTLSGRSLAHVMMMMIPAAWKNNRSIDTRAKDFYRYHSCLMEPWDGPAAITVTDGTRVGALLDRNGLRPARYIITKDDFVVMSSEVGVLDIPADRILCSGRLEPGKIFFIDTSRGSVIDDNELKNNVASKRPYGIWLRKYLFDLDDLRHKAGKRVTAKKSDDTLGLMRAFGYTREEVKTILIPMARDGKEPIGSMGNDRPHAVLSKRCQLLYNYFKQLFAQVTNPAIDPIREELVMSLESFIGPEGNLLDETPEHCHKLRVKTPFLTDDQLAGISAIDKNGFKTKTISILFDTGTDKSFSSTLDRICREAEKAIQEGVTFIILSDRGITKTRAPLPALLATGAVHSSLVQKSLRTRIGIIVESGEPREVHHCALLFGYGADCINPYLAYEALGYGIENEGLVLSKKAAEKNYLHALEQGILKIISKMGISTLQSYRGAQIFEALGLADEVIERAFVGTVSRIGGIGLDVIRQEAVARHAEGFCPKGIVAPDLSTGGVYQWKRDGEFHLWNPESIAILQGATRNNDYGMYKEFAQRINDQSAQPTTLRSLFRFKKAVPIPVDEVEPARTIFTRFATGAMSFGSISRGAHSTLAFAMNRLGGRSNTGEGGEDPTRFNPLPTGDSSRSAIKQVASGRFGVTTNYLVNADEIQIKIAQGAKPGEGGQLPGHKVSEIIAKTRYTTPGVTLISPPPHHDIYSIEDLAQLIFDLKNVNPKARISVKLVSEAGVGTVAVGVAKGHADMILISGGDGGTGASPLSSIHYAGLPWELGLSETHQTLVLNDLRSRVRLQTDGQMRTGRDVAIAAMLGAEEYGFCTAALIVMGCVMLRHCHLNNCSVGVATQDVLLEKRFAGKVDQVVNYFHFVAEELRETMA